MFHQFRLRNLKRLLAECPSLEKIIHFDTQEEYADNEIHFNEVRKIGREWLDEPENMTKFEELLKVLPLPILQISAILQAQLPIQKELSLLMEIMSQMFTRPIA